MSKPHFWMLVLVQFLLPISAATAQTNAPAVVVSIKPLHAMVSAVMAGVGEPDLVIDGSTSPHTFSLKPSMAIKLQNADIVFWIGANLETTLKNPLDNLAEKAQIIGFEYLEDGSGPHIWLDPQLAIIMVDDITRALADFDPNNANAYGQNASNYQSKIEDMQLRIKENLAPFSSRPIVMFHDAYAQFQTRFNLNIVGVVSISENQAPGPRHIRQIRQAIIEQGVICIFSEPQFNPKSIALIIEGTMAKSHELDPLGANLPAGPSQYIDLMNNMANALVECLED